jgi:hypothetical protein
MPPSINAQAYKRIIQKKAFYSFVVAGWKIAVKNFGAGFLFDRQLADDSFFNNTSLDTDCTLSFFQTKDGLPNFVSIPDSIELRQNLMTSSVQGAFDIRLDQENGLYAVNTLSAHSYSAESSELRVFSYKTDNPYLKLSVPFMNLLSNHAVLHDGLLLHGAGGVIKNKAFAILGIPGAGKSTAIGLIKPQTLLSDDVLVVRFTEKKPVLHATPLGTFSDGDKCGPLSRIFFPVKGDRFALKKLSRFEAVQRFYYSQTGYWERVFPPFRKMQFERVVDLFSKVCSFEMSFQKNSIDIEQIENCISSG